MAGPGIGATHRRVARGGVVVVGMTPKSGEVVMRYRILVGTLRDGETLVFKQTHDVEADSTEQASEDAASAASENGDQVRIESAAPIN